MSSQTIQSQLDKQIDIELLEWEQTSDIFERTLLKAHAKTGDEKYLKGIEDMHSLRDYVKRRLEALRLAPQILTKDVPYDILKVGEIKNAGDIGVLSV